MAKDAQTNPMGASGGCSCGLLPCICVGDTDNGADLPTDANAPSPENTPTTKAKLRQLFAANATSQCMSCMMLPCICPGEDETMLLGQDEATSIVAGSLLARNQDQGDSDEETDEYGRVRLGVVSAACQQEETKGVWVAREIKPLLKPHQIEGVKFLYDHVAARRGCILADYMGLGKTLQVITVIYSFLVDELDARKQRILLKEENSDSTQQDTREDAIEPPATVLVLCPAICLPNWDAEFRKWLSSEARGRCPVLTLDSSTTKGTSAGRLRLLERWKRTGGVLLMGYEMFRGLLNPTTTPSSLTDQDSSIRVCSRMASATMEVISTSAQETAKLQRTAREFRRLLCVPGADLVVMDEGHRMKDPSSLLCQSVAQIKSPRRLVLTGYPVQNSLSEYWCMVNFAREGFLGSYEEFRVKYERPILEGNAECSHKLIELLQSVVLRRGKTLLRSQLPPKMEWILYCKLSPVQHRLYCDFLEFYDQSGAAGGATADLLTAYASLLQVMNHPDIIYSKLCPSKEDLVLENDNRPQNNISSVDDSSGWAWESEERLQQKREVAAAQRRKRYQKLTDIQKSCEWARPVMFGKEELNPLNQNSSDIYRAEVLENSGKMAVLLQIVEESFMCGDKVVVFSQSVPTLKVISKFLRASSFSPLQASSDADAAKQRKRASRSCGPHTPKRRRVAVRLNRDPAGILRKRKNQSSEKLGSRVANKRVDAVTTLSPNDWFLQIDGSTSGSRRMEYIQRFSSVDSPVKLLLVSTRAGAEGINLHAANRLVLFDVSWNPSNDHQSMCRSHRIGQAKTVHVYRLVSTGTMERMIYEQQMKKVDLSTSVVDNQNVSALSGQHSNETSSSTKESSALVPFSGFLQPPAEVNYAKELTVDDPFVEEDKVLSSCVKKLGRWLVGVHLVHEPVDDEKQIE